MTVARRIARLIAATAATCGRRPLVTVFVAFALAMVGAVHAVHTLTFVSSHLKLLPQREPYVVRLEEYDRDFAELNDIVIVVESPTPHLSRDYAARLTHELRRAGLTSARITYRVDPSYFARRALLYLSVDDLTRLRDRLFDDQEFIETYAAHPTLPRLLAGLNQQIANQMVLGFFDVGLGGQESADLRVLESVIDQMAARLGGDSAYESPWASAFSVGPLDDPDAGYFFSSDRRWLFVLVQEDGDYVERRDTIRSIRGVLARLENDFPTVRAGVTGGPAISSDEMTTAFHDSKVATTLAFAFTLGLLVLGFRQVLKPLLMLMTLAASVAWSLGLVALGVGHLSIFSVMFISMVVAIGTDYGIYFLYRYEEELRLRSTPVEALRRTGERAGPGILLGALTATGAFVVLVLTDFQGVREFGIVSATAIVMAFLSMITLFPALLVLADRLRGWLTVRTPRTGATVREAGWLVRITRYRKAIMVGAAGLTVFAIWGVVRIDFSYNMLKLQAEGVESVVWEERILAKAGRSGFPALTTAPSLEQLESKRDAFAALPSVSKVESVLMLAPDRQKEKVKLIEQFAPISEAVQIGPSPALDPVALRERLLTLRQRLRVATAGDSEQARREVQPIQTKLDALLDRLARTDPAYVSRVLTELERQMSRDFADKLDGVRQSLHPRLVEPGDSPPELRRSYIGASGRYLLRIHPAVDIWQEAGAERFVTDLRTVDPDVTGPSVTSFEAIRFIKRGYLEGTLYALILVTVVSGAILRSALSAALALVPLALGVLWTVGSMHALDLQFDLANVWALPLIIGTAAEFGLNIFVRWEEGRDSGGPTLAQSTVMAVILNGFTTMAGFGSLMVAHHRGIFGLGVLLVLGMAASLVSALAVLPVLLRTFHGPMVPTAEDAFRGARKHAQGTARVEQRAQMLTSRK